MQPQCYIVVNDLALRVALPHPVDVPLVPVFASKHGPTRSGFHSLSPPQDPGCLSLLLRLSA